MRDAQVRPSHRKMDGEVVGVGKSADVGRHDAHAGAGPNCRCYHPSRADFVSEFEPQPEIYGRGSVRKITKYEAIDGRRFEHESGCREYEGAFGNHPGCVEQAARASRKIVERKKQFIDEELALRYTELKNAKRKLASCEIMKEDRNTLRRSNVANKCADRQ